MNQAERSAGTTVADKHSWRCELGFHVWSKWEITRDSQISHTEDGVKRIIGTIIEQRRVCSRCGLWGTRADKHGLF